ncbi:hypothetical protein GYMLUDRAFT_737808 [Collybiopsis luxurians FD-317 M1]|uniref:Uncharacterized protein n=1 Tax=Collybiopsis luxurians FD-317 M1 TaxID=944289 RepID=A0A0D0CI34_9AGAR|nr:hypothetical protein GYMLUDRAFT_737808 [Collybiopsis luxurians FD-317 M1]
MWLPQRLKKKEASSSCVLTIEHLHTHAWSSHSHSRSSLTFGRLTLILGWPLLTCLSESTCRPDVELVFG